MVKPGGTGTPRLVISASSQPFPPSRCRRALDPSALPLAKEYTYLGGRATPRAAFVRAPLRTVACAIASTPSVGPLGLQRKSAEKERQAPKRPALSSDGMRPHGECQRIFLRDRYLRDSRPLAPRLDSSASGSRHAPVNPAHDKFLDSRQMGAHREMSG